MSVKVMSWVWDQSRSKKTDRLVLLAIADCASDDGSNAYPSMAELMRKTGLSERGVQGCIGKLVGLKELIVNRNSGPGGCNRYRVLMNTPAAPAPGTVLEPSFEPSVEHSPSATPPKPPKPPKPKRGTDDDPNFAAFWTAYPRKTDKGHARTAWASAAKAADVAPIIAGAEAFAAQCARNRTETRFIPHPATWLRGERWSDEPQPAGERANGYQPFMNPTDEDAYGGTL